MKRTEYALGYTSLFNKNFSYNPLRKKVSAQAKVVIFSDSHLDGNFNQKQFNAIKRIIADADVVVINGDFWADKYITFDAFMHTAWRELFPLLRKKETYYLFGNHDMPMHSDERIFQFCTYAGFRLKLIAGKLLLHIEHGHLLSGMLIRTILMIFEASPGALHTVTFPIEQLSLVSVNYLKQTGSPLFTRVNDSYKRKREGLEPTEILVMGHTHTPQMDLENNYVNLGLTHHGYFSYAVVIHNKITLNTIPID